jgi:hypothetical protein
MQMQKSLISRKPARLALLAWRAWGAKTQSNNKCCVPCDYTRSDAFKQEFKIRAMDRMNRFIFVTCPCQADATRPVTI